MKIYTCHFPHLGQCAFALREHAERHLANNPKPPDSPGCASFDPWIGELELMAYDMNPPDAIQQAWLDETQVRGCNELPGVFA